MAAPALGSSSAAGRPDYVSGWRPSGMSALRFDQLGGYEPRRLNIVWLENTLDCRTWTYYCDLKDAMARLHQMCVPHHSVTCVEGRGRAPGFEPQVVVAGPRYMSNVAHADETLGFDRSRFAHLPLAVVQNKMYAATAREIVGDASAKLRWARAAGATVGFTWLKLADNFTQESGVPHYRLPFGVDAALYGKYAGTLDAGAPQPFDVGFTGASNHKYPLREAILALVRSMNVSSYLGTWQQTSMRVGTNNSWKALDRDGYVRQLSLSKMWVSTTGPSDIVGTRYFEVLASGTTLLLCNRNPGAYDELFEDGVHAIVFDGMDDLRAKILKYLHDEPARRRIVRAAAKLAQRVHTWDARRRSSCTLRSTSASGHTSPTLCRSCRQPLPSLLSGASIREPTREPSRRCRRSARSAASPSPRARSHAVRAAPPTLRCSAAASAAATGTGSESACAAGRRRHARSTPLPATGAPAARARIGRALTARRRAACRTLDRAVASTRWRSLPWQAPALR